MTQNKILTPHIPNSEPSVKAQMLGEVGAASIDEFYADVPEDLRLKRQLNLPAPFLSEYALRRHVENLLRKN